jgi:hypothetical protein
MKREKYFYSTADTKIDIFLSKLVSTGAHAKHILGDVGLYAGLVGE